MLNVISLGAGVQSTVMALMAAHGELKPMPDCAIFADTQWEPSQVYSHLDWLEAQLPFPVHRVTAGDIRADHLYQTRNGKTRKYTSMPLHTVLGMGRRQCTVDYKLKPIQKKLRDLIGLQPRQRAPKKTAVRVWIGISTDEAMRMKPARDVWVENIWPLIDIDMSRRDCLRWFEQRYPSRPLVKSACVGCPFHNAAMWRDIKLNDPVSFQDAVSFDKAVRHTRENVEQFVHRSCKPLDEVDFRNLEDMGQLNFFNEECEGMCGV